MRDIKLDDADDITFELTKKDEAVAQAVRIKLKTLLGEHFLDPASGLPVFDILGKKVSPAAVAHMVREQAQEVSGVELVEVISADLQPESRVLKIQLRVNGEDINV